MFFYFTDNFNYCNHSLAEMCYYNQNNVSSLTIILFFLCVCTFSPIFSPTSYMAVVMAMLAWKLLDCTGVLLSTEIQSLQDDKF